MNPKYTAINYERNRECQEAAEKEKNQCFKELILFKTVCREDELIKKREYKRKILLNARGIGELIHVFMYTKFAKAAAVTDKEHFERQSNFQSNGFGFDEGMYKAMVKPFYCGIDDLVVAIERAISQPFFYETALLFQKEHDKILKNHEIKSLEILYLNNLSRIGIDRQFVIHSLADKGINFIKTGFEILKS